MFRDEEPEVITRLDRLRALTILSPRNKRRAVGAFALVVLGYAALAVSVWYSGPHTKATRLHIENGDTFAHLFARAGLPDGELLAVMEANQGAAFDLALVPGEEVRIIRRDDGSLRQLIVGSGNGGATSFIANEGSRFTIERTAFWAPADGEAPSSPAADNAPNRLLAKETEKHPEAPAFPSQRTTVRADETAHPASASQAAARADAPPPPEKLQRISVRDGDSLYLIFNRNQLPQADLLDLLTSGESGRELKRLRPGQSIEFLRGTDGRIVRFHHKVDELTTLQFERGEGGFTVNEVTRDYDRRIVTKNGLIESSLFAAAAGIPDQVILQLVSVLGWDIDFARDLRHGDTFSVLYEELHVDGHRFGIGDILALEFRSKHAEKPIRAFRYTDVNGDTDFFSIDGRPLRRAFLRNPVQFSRISSRFSKSRLHPVLHRMRAHRGVDYAAARGTQVRATGDGHVTYKGRKGGYGKTIMLSHGNGYSTLYAHLSSYAKGMRKGTRVRQRQTIGRIGSTGMATGPHLHYEFRINGKHQDPLAVKLPRATPLDEAERRRFLRATEPLVARLDTVGATRLASLER